MKRFLNIGDALIPINEISLVLKENKDEKFLIIISTYKTKNFSLLCDSEEVRDSKFNDIESQIND